MRCETTGKVGVARWKMSEEEALKRDPGAVRMPGSMEPRTIYDRDELPPSHKTPPRPKWNPDDPF